MIYIVYSGNKGWQMILTGKENKRMWPNCHYFDTFSEAETFLKICRGL